MNLPLTHARVALSYMAVQFGALVKSHESPTPNAQRPTTNDRDLHDHMIGSLSAGSARLTT